MPAGRYHVPAMTTATSGRINVGKNVVEIQGVDLWLEDGISILAGIDWTVGPGQHWALLGPNGSGKSSLLSIVGARRFPSRGRVTVLGEEFGKTSMWDLRERIGVVDPASPTYDWFTVEEIVLTGLTGTVQPRWDCYGDADRFKAAAMLAEVGFDVSPDREIKTCSQGERQRVRIARALMSDPPLMLLDEPCTGLDLPAREAMLATLARLAANRPELATVFVSHHLEELPPTTTHALLLRDGGVVACGEVDRVITSACATACFGLPVTVGRSDGRWTARAAAGWTVGD